MKLYIWSSCCCSSIIAALCRVAMVPSACVSLHDFREWGQGSQSQPALLRACLREILCLQGKWLKRTKRLGISHPRRRVSAAFLFLRETGFFLRRDTFSASPPSLSLVFPQSRLDDMKCGIPFSTKCPGGVMWGEREGAAFWLAPACCHQRFLADLPSASAANSSLLSGADLVPGDCIIPGRAARSGALYKGSVKQMRPVLCGRSKSSSFPQDCGKRPRSERDSQVGQRPFGPQIPAASCTHLADAMSAFEIPAGIYSGAVLFAFSGSGQAASVCLSHDVLECEKSKARLIDTEPFPSTNQSVL